jgi:hypothetical protein
METPKDKKPVFDVNDDDDAYDYDDIGDFDENDEDDPYDYDFNFNDD